MSEEWSSAMFFSVPDPAAVSLPHLITALDPELLGKVAHLTDSSPGLWHLPAPFDEDDVFDPWRDAAQTPFARWGLPANQADLMGGGRWTTEALFGTHCILLDAGLDEPAVAAVAQLRAERHDNGGFYQEHFEDWPGLPRLLELTPWALLPVTPDRSLGLFVTAPGRAEWVRELEAWCGRVGRHYYRGVKRDGVLAIEETPAPTEARARAAASQADQFLSRADRYFRLSDDEVLALVRDRLEAGRRLRAEVAKARANTPPHRPAPVRPPGPG
jgi:hypothetical protein